MSAFTEFSLAGRTARVASLIWASLFVTRGHSLPVCAYVLAVPFCGTLHYFYTKVMAFLFN